MSPYKDPTLPRRILLLALLAMVGFKVVVTLLEARYGPSTVFSP